MWGLILSSEESESKEVFGASMSQGRLKGTYRVVHEVCKAIYSLDLQIDAWNEQLKRAQPHRKGRLVLKFTRASSTNVSGQRIYDVDPVVGRMTQNRRGEWRFLRLTVRDRYKKLSDLRVGKSLKSDPLVVRLIDGIEEMLKERDFLCETLSSFRSRELQGRVASILASTGRRGEQIIDLSYRVKLDWTQGAEKCEESLREVERLRKARYRQANREKQGVTV